MGADRVLQSVSKTAAILWKCFEVSMQITSHKVALGQLLLDPNNYRFHDLTGYRPVNWGRYAEPGVQARALQFLMDTPSFDLGSLRESIIANGFVPFEQIVVEAFTLEAKPPLFVIVEGNRRAAAIQTILRDHEGGALDLRPDVFKSLSNQRNRDNWQR